MKERPNKRASEVICLRAEMKDLLLHARMQMHEFDYFDYISRGSSSTSVHHSSLAAISETLVAH